MIDELADALGGVDVLVNNAGTGGGAPLFELPYEDWRCTIAVDLDGAFLCAQRGARWMIEQGRGGRIVNVTSVHEHTPQLNSGAYTIAKHGLGGLTKQLALELGRHGITVNSVAPGMIATPMTGLDDEDPSRHPKREYRCRLDDRSVVRRRRRLPARQPLGEARAGLTSQPVRCPLPLALKTRSSSP